ncbi:MAG: hypothetical protein NUW01_18250 [Gemmatimonadaceae bacterium]|nr:hypothetical protein [Gemmatimonadaceae bacterium]
MTAQPRTVSPEAQATLAFAEKLELALSVAGFCTDKNTVYEPVLTSWIRPVAEFTICKDGGTFRVTVEHVGEEMA